MTDHTFPGSHLRERREEFNLSADDVYRCIRIPSEHVEALERGDLDALPTPCYTIGFIKSYCEFLGLAPEPFIECARNRNRGTTPFLGIKQDDTRRAAAWTGEVFTWLTICALVVLSWCAYTYVVRPQDDVIDGRVRADAIEMVLPPLPEELPR